MIRVALYARHSSDQQSSAPIADPQRICRDRAKREGWHIVGTHEDAAISGARMILHPGDTRGVVHATLRGSLMEISDFANDNPQPDASRVTTSAASAWFGGHSRSVGQMDSASSPA